MGNGGECCDDSDLARRQYTAEGMGQHIRVTAGGFVAYVDDEKQAVNWLASHSLRKGKARALVAEEMALNGNFGAISGDKLQLKAG